MGNEPEAQRFDFVGMAWRRKWLILFGMAVGLGLGYLNYKQQTPIYTSSAKVMITPKDQSTVIVPGTDGGPMFQDMRSNRKHGDVIRSTTFIKESVVPSAGIDADCPSLSGLSAEMKLATIRGGLNVQADNGSDGLYFITYSSPSQGDCDEVLDSVLAAYQEYLNKKFIAAGSDMKDLLEEARLSYDEKAQQIQTTIDEVVELNGDQLAFWNEDGIINIEQERMQEIDAHIRGLELERTDLKTQLDRIVQLEEEGKTQDVILFILERNEDVEERTTMGSQVQSDPGEMNIFNLRLRLERMLLKYGEDHPEVKTARNEIKAWEDLMASRGEVVPVEEKEERPDFVGLYKLSLQEQLRTIDYKLTEFRVQFDGHSEKAKELNKIGITLRNLYDEKKYQESMVTTLANRLQGIDVTGDKQGFNFELLEPPGFASHSSPDLFRILTMGGFLGVLAGLGLGALVELADKTFRSPDEIAQSLSLPIVGHIPFMTKAQQEKTSDSHFHESAITVHRPKGKISEAYRAVRTALFFSNRQSNHQVIQVTSPSPGDGKSTLACNLAISIAQSGKRVLLVDADLRRPRQHKVVGEDADHGFSAVLRGELAVAEAALPTQVPGLFFIPCGERPSNPAELLTSPKLPEFIEVAREQYDYVIIDSPPLLAVTDPAVIAPRVDTVILTFRIRKNIKVTSDRAREILSSVGANILGVVVNGIGGSAGYGDYKYGKYGRSYAYNYRYGKYGSSGYGNGAQYGYGYGYGYDYEEADKYYDDPNSPQVKRKPRVAGSPTEGPANASKES